MKKKHSVKDWVDALLGDTARQYGKCGLPIGVIAGIEQVIKFDEIPDDQKVYFIKLLITKMRSLEQDKTIPEFIGEEILINPKKP